MPAPPPLYRLAASVLALLVGIAAGCSSAPTPAKVAPTIDQLIEIALETPAYGGIRVVNGDPEKASAWTVFLFDESEEADARVVLWNVLGPRAALINIDIRPKQKQVEPAIVDRVGETLRAIDGVNGGRIWRPRSSGRRRDEGSSHLAGAECTAQPGRAICSGDHRGDERTGVL